MYKIIITLLLFCCATAYGAEVDNALLKKNLEVANLQIEVLKAQVEVMKSYQDKFLSTVYWSLSGVVGVVVLLIGYNWFTNFKNQEKEKDYFQAFISTNLELVKQDLINSLNQNRAELEKNIEGSVTAKVKKDFYGLEQKSNNLVKEVDRIKLEVLKLEYNEWTNKKVYGNSVTVAVEMIDLSRKIDSFMLENSLEKLTKILELGLKERMKSTLDVDSITQIEKVFSKLNDHYKPIKSKIDGLIRQINSI